MRVRLSTRPVVLFGAMLVVALVVFLPMRLALGLAGVGEQGFVVRRVSGTIWGATLADARFGEVALGTLGARLSPWPLLAGRARIVFAGPQDAAAPIRGQADVSRHGFGIDGVTAHVATGRLFAPLPVTALDLDDVSVRFRDGACESADGRVRASVAGDAGGIVLPPTMGGTARCDGTALLLPLASQAGAESVALRIEGDGRYRAELAITPADPLAGQRLERLGFVSGANGYRLSIEGRF